MQRHFEKELEGLKTSLIKMASLVEDSIGLAIEALLNQDAELAKRVIEGDGRINSLELEIDNAIVDLLALQQPVAIDLRLILAATKINSDLERIGDHAVNIAESALAVCVTRPEEPMLDLPRMAEITQKMLRNALDSFIHNDPKMSKTVLVADDMVDELNRKMTRDVINLMRENPSLIDGGLQLIRVSKNLERVADLATNIAEEVIFVAEALVVKHHAADEVLPKPKQDEGTEKH